MRKADEAHDPGAGPFRLHRLMDRSMMALRPGLPLPSHVVRPERGAAWLPDWRGPFSFRVYNFEVSAVKAPRAHLLGKTAANLGSSTKGGLLHPCSG
jgi:hypothetical protein